MYTAAPPTEVDQGTLVDDVYFYALDESHRGIVLTPTCDIELNKAELIQLVAVLDAWEVVGTLLESDWSKAGLLDAQGQLLKRPLSAGKRNIFASEVGKIIRQQYPRYHWLAPLSDGANPLIVDFQVLTSILADELPATKILAGLRSPFREQLADRYAAYMGRVGTPNFSDAEIALWIDSGIENIFPPTP